MIILVAAMDSKNGIGIGNALPWHLPNDLKHFRWNTARKTIVMGRKTFESIGSKPLSGRRNIVMTADTEFKADGVEVVHSLFDLIELFPNIKISKEEVWVIGGAQIYALFMPLASQLVITEVEGDFDTNVFFPQIHSHTWKLVTAFAGKRDKKNVHNHVFKFYERVEPFETLDSAVQV